MKRILLLLLFLAVAMASYLGWNVHRENEAAAAYAAALRQMKQSGHDQHSTGYMNPAAP